MNVSEMFRAHYLKTFLQSGATPRGVDWEEPGKAALRHEAMLQLIPAAELSGHVPVSLLDVGCGYGAFYEFLHERRISNIRYTGIDLVDHMVRFADGHFKGATFLTGDVLEMPLAEKSFDYVIANGVFTQKLHASDDEMDQFVLAVIKRMFALCRKGLAFNVMTTLVDFENPENYYRHPGAMVDLTSELTRSFRLNHSYPLYEFTMSLYR